MQHRFELAALQKRLRFYAQLARSERFAAQQAKQKLAAPVDEPARGIAEKFARKLGRNQVQQPEPVDLTATQQKIKDSGLFDAQWYRRRYPDIDDSSDPLVHYLHNATTELRDPNPSFSTSYYLDHYDVPPLTNTLADYLANDRNRQRRTSRFGPIDNPNRLRVVFVSVQEPGEPGHRYRIEDVAAALTPYDVEAIVTRINEYPARLHEVANCDVVWLWRQQMRPGVRKVLKTAKANGVPVVADIDDLIFDVELINPDLIDGIRSQGEELLQVRDRSQRMRRVLEGADILTTTTEPLRRELARINPRCFVIPNGFDERSWRVSALARSLIDKDDLIRLGYAAGTKTHQRDFAVAAPAVADALASNPRVRLVLFKGTLAIEEFPMFDAVIDQIEWRDLVPLEQLPLEYARFDINLAPLETGNVFCESKSSLKYFEAALVHVPTVASPTQPFAQAIDHGRTGFLAADVDQWRDVLISLVESPELREKIAHQAFVDSVQRFGPVQRAPLVQDVIRQALSLPAEPLVQLTIPKLDYVSPTTVQRRRLDSVATVFVPQSVDHSIAQLAVACDLVACDDHPQLDELRAFDWAGVTLLPGSIRDLPNVALHATTARMLVVSATRLPDDALAQLELAREHLELHRVASVKLGTDEPWAELFDVFALIG